MSYFWVDDSCCIRACEYETFERGCQKIPNSEKILAVCATPHEAQKSFTNSPLQRGWDNLPPSQVFFRI